ncbi:MAG: GntR family transcriptional regulator, partial [Bradyrhizobium sp.]|nr:GntR family transcriptional regulator [Bradyrhizobium sp.]
MALLADLPRPLADNVIVERVFAAVMEHKLPPGAKLAENALCEAFEASRAQIRRVLVVLAGRSVVTLHPNRGAYVSSPSASEAREVFEARRAIERSVVLSAATAIDERTLAELRANSRAGAAAEARGERSESIRLSGQFHIRLAEIAGNSVLTRYLEELVARTSLIIGLYGSTR